MLTAFGKILRKLRIDNGEILKSMADQLGISSSYLSAIEMGKRVIPEDFITRLSQIYALSGEDIQQLENAKLQGITQVKLDINNVSSEKRNAALVFARKFEEMDEQTVNKVLAVLNKRSRSGD